MATITINANLGDLGLISNFIDGSHLHVVTASDTTLTLEDGDGDGFTFQGSGLTYLNNTVLTGKFTGLTIYQADGGVLETVTNFSVKAPLLAQVFAIAGVEAAVLSLLSKDDNVIGSVKSDLLVGAAGNDTIKGGAGADIIGGSKGDDQLFGQGGSDQFLFVAGDGTDHIMDFTDTGGANDDHIVLTHKMFRAMVVEDTATGVTLHFGAKGAIEVDNWHSTDVGQSDFVLT